jgi:hypothetical protein
MFIMNDEIFQILVLHQLRLSYIFLAFILLWDIMLSHLWIRICWNILASLGWMSLDHGEGWFNIMKSNAECLHTMSLNSSLIFKFCNNLIEMVLSFLQSIGRSQLWSFLVPVISRMEDFLLPTYTQLVY